MVKNSTSENRIWQAFRQHLRFKSSGSHFLDFHIIHLEPSERPKDLYQRLNSFVEDNLLKDRTSVPGGGSGCQQVAMLLVQVKV